MFCLQLLRLLFALSLLVSLVLLRHRDLRDVLHANDNATLEVVRLACTGYISGNEIKVLFLIFRLPEVEARRVPVSGLTATSSEQNRNVAIQRGLPARHPILEEVD